MPPENNSAGNDPANNPLPINDTDGQDEGSNEPQITPEQPVEESVAGQDIVTSDANPLTPSPGDTFQPSTPQPEPPVTGEQAPQQVSNEANVVPDQPAEFMSQPEPSVQPFADQPNQAVAGQTVSEAPAANSAPPMTNNTGSVDGILPVASASTNATANSPAPQSPLAATPPAKKQSKLSGFKFILGVILLVLAFAGSVAGAYYLGTKSSKSTESTDTQAKSIQLPPEAKVTAECIPGRGKQYIIPKDIPVGPIYDVKDGNVIAVEYLISVSSIFSQADLFTDRITELTKNYPVDHFKIVPAPPFTGGLDQQIHLIMFIVPKTVAEGITCQETPTATSS